MEGTVKGERVCVNFRRHHYLRSLWLKIFVLVEKAAMTDTTIAVYFKQTGERIDVPVSLTSTVVDIIKYVCNNSEKRTNIDYDDYYLSLNNVELLDNHKTLREINALEMDEPHFQLCMKTGILMKLIDLCLMHFRTGQNGVPAKPQKPTNAAQPEEMNRIDINESNRLASDSSVNEVATEIVSPPFEYPIPSNESICITDSRPPIPPPEETVPSSTRLEGLIDQETTPSDTLPKEGLTSNRAETVLNDGLQGSSIPEILGHTYIHVTCSIDKMGEVATRDPIMRRNISDMFQEVNLFLCGSPRVGKSTLVNAICQQNVARTSPGLNSCTKGISRYYLQGNIERDREAIHYQYNFWDTPGFENWNELEIKKGLETILNKPKSDLLCMIYCASPGSHADLKQLGWLVEQCTTKQIFCALVCTNKWGGQPEQQVAVMQDFERLLTRFHAKTREENGITHFGNVALCTSVNSKRYVDGYSGKHVEQSGINELIFGIMESLDMDKIAQWCLLALENKPFWKSLFNAPKHLQGFLDKLRDKNRMQETRALAIDHSDVKI